MAGWGVSGFLHQVRVVESRRHTLSIVLRISNSSQRALAILHRHRNDIVPLRVRAIRPRAFTVQVHSQRRNFLSPKLLFPNLARLDSDSLVRGRVDPLGAFAFPLFQESPALHLERGKLHSPFGALRKLLGRVLSYVGAEAIPAPGCGGCCCLLWLLLGECAQGQAGCFVDGLPDVLLGFVGEGFEEGWGAGEVCGGPESAVGLRDGALAFYRRVGVALGIDAGGALGDVLGRGLGLEGC